MNNQLYDISMSPNDGDVVEVRSTSASTATVTPIILSQSDTDVTRIVFEPLLVDNIHDSEKCVSGKLVYERRRRTEEYPTERVSPRNIRVGEVMELTLDTSTTLALFQSLASLYDMYEANGIPYGIASYKRVDSSFREFLKIIQNDPSAARMIGNKDNFELVKILLQQITKTDSMESLANALRNLQNNNIEQLTETINIERLSRIISLISDNMECGVEEFWQKEVFKENSWVISQLFSSPCAILADKAYVGGKSINNRNGNVCDFIYQNRLSNNVVIIEIKTPETEIFHGAYRDTYSLSYEISGAINQVINYRDKLVKEFNNIRGESEVDFVVFNPKCVVIAGKMSKLSKKEKAAFENYRNNLNNIEIITFDEVLLKLSDLREIFLEDIPAEEETEYDFPF